MSHNDPEKVDAARVLAAMAFTSWPPESSDFEQEEPVKPKRSSGKQSPRKRTSPARKRKRDEEPDRSLAEPQQSSNFASSLPNLPPSPFGYGPITSSSQPLSTAAQHDLEARLRACFAVNKVNTNTAVRDQADTPSTLHVPGMTFDDLVDTSQCSEAGPSVAPETFAKAMSAPEQPIPASSTKPLNLTFPILDAFCHHPDVLLYLTTQHMHPEELLTLYTISKPFHYLVNSRYTTWMLCSARKWARLAPETTSDESDVEEVLWGSISAFDEAAEETTTEGNPTTSDTAPPPPQKEEGTDSLPKAKDKGKGKAPISPSNRRPPPSLDPMKPSPPGAYNIWDITTLLPFTNYVHLCTPDPTLRTVSPSSPSASLIRHVPTFRYLFFLLHRHNTVTRIRASMLTHGHALPPTLCPALIKLSLLMDIPTTVTRAALWRNRKYFEDGDLLLLTLFFLKLDMLFTDPLDGDVYGPEGTSRLRECLLAQRSLTVLKDVLEPFVGRGRARASASYSTSAEAAVEASAMGAGKSNKSSLDILKAWVQWRWVPRPEHVGMSILGVPGDAVGGLRWEGWTAPWVKEREAMMRGESVRKVPGLLMPVDEGVMREGLRRGLKLEKLYLLMMLHGYK